MADRPVLPLGGSRPRVQQAALAVGAIVGMALAVSSFLATRASEEREGRARFERTAADRVAAIQVALGHIEGDLAALGALLASPRPPDRAEFHAVTSQLLRNHRDTTALQWIPRVSAAERAGFERAGRLDGFDGFQITEQRGPGVMVRAAERRAYYPVAFLEPLPGNERALGFDMASDPTRRAAIDRAIGSGGATVSGRVTLVQDRGQQLAVLVLEPVYGRTRPDVAARGEAVLLGFALGVYRVGDLLDRALGPLAREPVELEVFDRDAPPDESFLASYREGRSSIVPLTAAARARSPRLDAELHLGDRRWIVRCRPADDLAAAHRSWKPWAILGSGLAVTLLLVVVALLTGEVARRDADRRFGALLDRLSIGALVVDAAGVVHDCNDALLAVVGRRREELRGADFFACCVPAAAREAARARVGARLRGEVDEAYDELEIEAGGAGGELRVLGFTSTVLPGEDARLVAVGLDVTERQRAAADQRFLAALVEHMQEAVITVDLGLRVRTWSAGARLVYGWEADEVVGRPALPLLQPGVSEAEAERFAARVGARGRDRAVVRQRRKDGEEIVVDSNLAALRSATGEVTGFLAVCRDVTAQERTERALRESEARFRALADGAPVGIFQTDRGGRCVFVNEAWQRITGRRAEQAGGDGWLRSLHPGDREEVMAAWNAAVAAGSNIDGEFRCSANGGRTWVQAWGAPLRGDAGLLVGYVGILVDVTRRKETERLLREAEQRLLLGMRGARTSFFDWDLEAGELRHDPRFHAWAHVPPLIRGRPEEIVDVLAGPEDRARLLDAVRRVRAGESDALRLDHRRPPVAGRVEWVRIAGTAIARDVGGAPRRIVGTVADITDWKELQERAAWAERLTSLTTLARRLSHELNSPLASILSNVCYAREQVRGVARGAFALWASEGNDGLDELAEALDDATGAAARVRAILAQLNGLHFGALRDPDFRLGRHDPSVGRPLESERDDAPQVEGRDDRHASGGARPEGTGGSQ